MKWEDLLAHLEIVNTSDTTMECVLHLVDGTYLKIDYTKGDAIEDGGNVAMVYIGKTTMTIPPEVILYIESTDKDTLQVIKW